MRQEKDFLGSREVPDEVYYGIQTLRAVDNFPITGYRPHEELIRGLALVKAAAARANMETGSLNKTIGEAIVQAAEEIASGRLHESFVVDVIQGGAGTSMNMNTNEVIANRAIEILGGEKGDYARVHPNSHVNMGQSTNDVFPTAVRIACLNVSQALLSGLSELRQAFERKAEEFDGVLKMGRTHLQDAVPIRLGQEFSAYARMIGRDRKRLENAVTSLEVVNMGATAVGTGLNADPAYIARVTDILGEISGLPLRRAENLVDATQNTDAFLEVSGSLKTLAVDLSKVANDLRLMASGPRAGLKEINLPPQQPGSSIMPGKVNPVIPEVVNQVAFQVQGNDLTVSLACGAGQLELNVMEPVIVFNLLQSLDILRNVVRVFRERCVVGITANGERCAQMVENSVGVITAINPHVGYEVASAIAKEAINSGRPVREIVLEKGVLTEEELNIILHPLEMTNPGIAGAKLLKR
ncbi:fumarate hydratase/aspartate ammonia-lyase [Acididesulfobacillus acetoxydans]|uniref:Aspartate ammonia-lyase n=1 Tax=Acididesulfobacillus acetoxydans TaxID=1561005 RepID=A0A8S0WDQ2_9FIRM|nr:aspartate ammonia-lyase [Acididesulfobacillus acetoxydans]CAA7599442.1 fumarate hydratase/aspartate ammonia-lyase [Acididesulfobacillus acetoxydans]CEJ06753.1 Aspartate ammonia-lyase [Acididesulfobacillus acetoxydans]